jgi:hypothetical protein
MSASSAVQGAATFCAHSRFSAAQEKKPVLEHRLSIDTL